MTATAKVYGDALYELAASEALSDPLWEQWKALSAILRENPTYLALLQNPAVAKEERLGLIDSAFRGALHPYLLNFLKLLCERGKLSSLEGCAARFEERWLTEHGMVKVKAASATPLSQEQSRLLREKLEQVTGKAILLETAVEPSMIGGIRVLMNGRVWDGSVRGRLRELGDRMKNTVL